MGMGIPRAPKLMKRFLINYQTQTIKSRIGALAISLPTAAAFAHTIRKTVLDVGASWAVERVIRYG
jgi:hypothetical protein